MDEGIVAPLSDLDREMSIMDPEKYILRSEEIFERRLRAERQQSDRRLQEDDPGFGPPHRCFQGDGGIRLYLSGIDHGFGSTGNPIHWGGIRAYLGLNGICFG